MGNLVTSRLEPGAPDLRMSNGLTSVFLDVLALAASRHARTPWELRLAQWLVEHDPERCGLGVVGFDVSELGWSLESFEAQRRFLLQLVDAALAKEGWERLPFQPLESSLFPALSQFRERVARLPRQDIQVEEGTWIPEDPPAWGLCEVHHVHLHALGCILCNDAPLDAPPAQAPHRTSSP
ncbi:hypothetical protein ACN47A_20540 [Myxococcus fulvus]|uniref:hypothetical protein n=1 Tax=Myxococcus fulvus TaxID=33 RepID=UPI003B9BCA44